MPIWRKSAPAAVRKAYRKGRESTGWKAWRWHLRNRKQPIHPSQLGLDGQRALVWGLDNAANPAVLLPPFSKADRSAATKALDRWFRDSAGREFELDHAQAALWWCHGLPDLAAVLPADSWWNLLDHLRQMAVEAGVAGCRGESSAGDPLIHQLLAGELALTLAYLFPEIAACRPCCRKLAGACRSD